MQVFNAATQQLEDVDWSIDGNGEIVATFGDGSFLKFPAGIDHDQLQALVDLQQTSNEGQEVITPEDQAAADAQYQASQELINELNGNTMPESANTHASTTDR